MQKKSKITEDQRHLILFHKYKRRITFTDVAVGIGMSKSNLHNILFGRSVFSELTARKLAEFFGFDWHDFYKEENGTDDNKRE